MTNSNNAPQRRRWRERKDCKNKGRENKRVEKITIGLLLYWEDQPPNRMMSGVVHTELNEDSSKQDNRGVLER